MTNQNVGTIVTVIGAVLDIKFHPAHLPNLLNAIEIDNNGQKLVVEVAQHIGDDIVRCIAMGSTDGLVRGMEAVDTGASAMDVICAVADAGSVVELKGGYATHCVTALATVGGTTVGFVAFDGSAVCPACAYKAEAFVKLCDAYNLPILTVADADGFVKDAENAMLTAATRMETAYATATCPKIALITSKSIGGAYIALAGKGANADLTFAWDTAVLSPLDAEAAVAFLYSDRLAAGENRGSLVKEYKETLASPYTAAASGAIDDVIVPADSRAKVMAALDILAGKRENTLPRKHSVK